MTVNVTKHILVIGSGGREASIIKTLHKSQLSNTIYCMGTNYNPLILDLCSFVYFSNTTFLVDFCKQKQIDLEFQKLNFRDHHE